MKEAVRLCVGTKEQSVPGPAVAAVLAAIVGGRSRLLWRHCSRRGHS